MPWQGVNFQGLAEVRRVPHQNNASCPPKHQTSHFTLNLILYSLQLTSHGQKPCIRRLGPCRRPAYSDDEGQKRSPPTKPKHKFNTINIRGELKYGLGKLPEHVARDPYSIFSLFFGDDILQTLVNYTNEYAAEHSSEEDKPFARKWIPTTVPELRTYIATYIYMGIHQESSIADYWNEDPAKPLHPEITKHIGLKRWQQINRVLRISPPMPTQSKLTVFDKLEGLSDHLRTAFKLYWEPDTHLTVHESIQRFLGRSEATVNIPSKPVPKGYKIWVLANSGYVMD